MIQVGVQFLLGSSCADTIQPILYSGSIDFGFQVLVGSYFHEYQNRAIVTFSYFGGESDVVEGFYELYELSFRFRFALERLVDGK